MDIYSHVLPGMQEEAALAVEKLLERAWCPRIVHEVHAIGSDVRE